MLRREALLSITLITFCSVACIATQGVADQPDAKHGTLEKVGTIDVDLVETSPVVFNGKLYRFESVRPNYPGNKTGKAYYRFVDAETGEHTPAFGEGHALGSAYVEDGTVYVFGVPGWGASTINVFTSKDMKNWEKRQALDPGWELYNTSVCKAGDRYIMAFEVGGPAEVAGQRFTGRFAESKDLLNWELIPEPAVYTKEKYSACPTIRWSDGWFYMTYLDALGGYRFATQIVRSKDLVNWEDSLKGPVLMFDGRDKTIASDDLTPSQIEHIKKSFNGNNSDHDMIEFDGKVVMYYSWGDQRGNEFLAKAVFHGSMKELFKHFFPE